MNTWRGFLRAGFLLLCARYQFAVIHAARAEWPELLPLIFGGFLLGFYDVDAALFAFSIAIPFLVGLGQVGFLTTVSLPTLVFSALWTGVLTRTVVKYVATFVDPATSMGNDGLDHKNKGTGSPKTNHLFTRNASEPYRYVAIITKILMSAILLSLAWQSIKTSIDSGWQSAVNWPATFAYSDPKYFLTSGFLWLQGLFYFEALFSVRSSDLSSLWARWIGMMFKVYVCTMALFASIQLKYHIPEGWTHAGIQSPFEDISSFGSMAAAVFIYFVVKLDFRGWRATTIDIIFCLAALFMLSASWSRGAWFAALCFLGATVSLRFSRKYVAAFLMVILATLMLINSNVKNSQWARQPYLARLLALFRFENPENKDSGRLHLYKKAANMIRERPLLGHGVGSFYLKSVQYASPNDTSERVRTPDFAHNVLLQLAAEDGTIIAALFGALIIYVLWRGMRFGVVRRRNGNSEVNLLLLAATLSLACYLQTQMTANSLNVYVSNQYFFWLLIVGILGICSRDSEHVF